MYATKQGSLIFAIHTTQSNRALPCLSVRARFGVWRNASKTDSRMGSFALITRRHPYDRSPHTSKCWRVYGKKTPTYFQYSQSTFFGPAPAAAAATGGSLPRPYTSAVMAPAPSNNAIQGPYKPTPTGILPTKMDRAATTKVYGLVVRTCSPSPQPKRGRGGRGGEGERGAGSQYIAMKNDWKVFWHQANQPAKWSVC